MQVYKVIFRSLDGEDELPGFHFPEHNASFLLEPTSGIFSFHSGKPTLVEGNPRAWGCGKDQELNAFAEFLDLWCKTGQEPTEGEFFCEEN